MTMVDSVASQLGRNIQPTYGYYRQPNGWITISPITRLERIQYIEEGWEQLSQYGAFDMTPYVANHPMESLFMFGGTHELIPEQIIQQGLYVDPPLVPTCNQHITQFHRSHSQSCWNGARKIRFPQIEDMEGLGPFPCSFCDRKLATEQGRSQHQKVAHSEEVGNLRTGQSLGAALSDAMNAEPRGNSELRQEIEDLKALLATLTKEESTP